MKLVEITARDVKEWPEGALFIDQAADGDLIANYDLTEDDYKYIGVHEKAVDWTEAKVTRAQWESERERVEKMQKSMTEESSFVSGELLALGGVGYEQELWDKVAGNCYSKYAHKNADRQKCASWAFADADAFMAERAKRMSK